MPANESVHRCISFDVHIIGFGHSGVSKCIGCGREYTLEESARLAASFLNEFNPYHDELGRFASADGAVNFSVVAVQRSKNPRVHINEPVIKSEKPTEQQRVRAREVIQQFPGSMNEEEAVAQIHKADAVREQYVQLVDRQVGDISQLYPDVEVTGRLKDSSSMVGKVLRKPHNYSDVSQQALSARSKLRRPMRTTGQQSCTRCTSLLQS